jgi:hypothetical protein
MILTLVIHPVLFTYFLEVHIRAINKTYFAIRYRYLRVTNNFTLLYFKILKTEAEWKVITNGFNDQWNYPTCLGAVDGNHASIKNPPRIFQGAQQILKTLSQAISSTEHEEQVATQHHCRLLTPEIHPQVQNPSEIVAAIF